MLRKENKKTFIFVVLILFFSIISAIFCESYFVLLEQKVQLADLRNFVEWKNLLLNFSGIRIFIVSICFILIGTIITFFADKKKYFLYHYRYILAIFILILCIIFEINGSSIGIWQNYLGDIGHEPLLGISRAIRSDEWATNTPMLLSQYFNNAGDFPYFGETLRGAVTDMFMVYGQPVKDVAIVFRPFHWGYLFLSPAKGLSFFWMGRLIALFMVSFEFGMLIAKKNKVLACTYAFLVTWAPIVQWWYAINSLVELLVVGQLAILMIYFYIKTDNYIKRALCMLIVAWCGGIYILSLYPAWQVALAYVFLALFIWVLIENVKQAKWGWKDGVIIISCFILIGLGVAYVILKSWPTIQAVLNSAYPGHRTITGGELKLSNLVNFIGSIFYPLDEPNINTNAPEMATFFDFFPMGLLLAIFVVFKEKRHDKLLISLMIVLGILLSFCFIEWPVFLAKISLLSNAQEKRVFLAVGLINILLLIRSMSLMEYRIKTVVAAVLAVLLAGMVSYLAYYGFNGYLVLFRVSFSFIILMSSYFFIIKCSQKNYKHAFFITTVLIVFMGGMFVNPIEQGGLESIYDQKIIQEIKTINEKEPGKWIVEGAFPINNLPIVVGASTINSTNTYPNIERWESIDREQRDNEIYNRYAHIAVRLQNEDITTFELMNADAFKVNLNNVDLKKLDVRYILSENNLENYNTETINFIKLYDDEKFKIYEVKYMNQ